MPRIIAQGRVVEMRRATRTGGSILILDSHGPGERAYDVASPHDAVLGAYVWIYDDGMVDVRQPPAPDPTIEVPGAPEPDHS